MAPGWHLLRLPETAHGPERVRLRLVAAQGTVREYDFHAPRGRDLTALLFLDPTIVTLEIDADGPLPKRARHASLRRVSRARAALALARRDPARTLGGLRSSAGPATGIRRALAQATTRARAPDDYASWLRAHDALAPETLAALEARTQRWDASLPRVTALVFGPDGGAAEATVAAWAAAAHRVRTAAILAGALADPAADYLVVLQAGELCAPGTAALLRLWLDRPDAPDAVYADEDQLDTQGRRHAPLLKPDASRSLMRSGLLTTGLWAFRRTRLAGAETAGAEAAEPFRLAQWLRLDASQAGCRTDHLPLVLTHRRPDTAVAAAAQLAAVVSADAARTGRPVIFEATRPLRVRPAPTTTPAVAFIVPTAARDARARRCIQRLLAETRYPALELLAVTMQEAPLTPAQSALLASIVSDPRARALPHPGRPFNYSAANNLGAAETGAPLLCLVNDDVEPIDPDWLTAMVAHFADPEVAIVGAKLLYPNGAVQHGGVLLGCGALTEHAFRDLPGDAPGYAARALLDQEYQAVTGACMLVRASVYAALGGQDEAFGSAFGDVDFCLRARAAGHRVVWSAASRLVHRETATFGHHYGTPYTARESADMLRLRQRWPAETTNDPFYHPALSARAHQQWALAWPPRLRRDAFCAALLTRPKRGTDAERDSAA